MIRLILLSAIATLLVACSTERAPLVAADVIVKRPLPGMHMSAGYLTFTNNSAQAITLTDVTSPQFAAVEMHESVVEDGIARMYPLGDLTILAGTTVRFEPGGKHLMLMRPIGEFESVTLEFHADDAIILTLDVALTD